MAERRVDTGSPSPPRTFAAGVVGSLWLGLGLGLALGLGLRLGLGAAGIGSAIAGRVLSSPDFAAR